MNIKNNRRFQSTAEAIQNSLLELLESKTLRQISVKELCEKAGINRSSFYAHYADLYDLMARTEERINRELLQVFEGLQSRAPFFSAEYFTRFLQFAGEHRNFYREFVHQQQSFPIDTGFQKLWQDCMLPYYTSAGLTCEKEMMYHFVFFQAGFTTVLKRWLDQGCLESPESIAEVLMRNVPFA